MSSKAYLHEPIYFMPTAIAGHRIRCWKSSPDPAPAPDYAAAANQTAEGNLEMAKYTTQANRANQYTPWGSLTWTQGKNEDGTGNNEWTQNTTLDPRLQSALDSQIAVQGGRSDAANTLLGRVQNQIATPIDLSTAGKLQDVGGFNAGNGQYQTAAAYDPSRANQYAKAAYDAQMTMLQPEYDRKQQQMENANALKGLANTSEAYQADEDAFARNKGQALNQLANQSLITGNQLAQQDYQTQLQGLAQNNQTAAAQNADARSNYASELTGVQQNNATQQAKIQELMNEYNTPLNQLNSLLTGQQVAQPQFSSYAGQANVGGADMLSAANNQAAYNQNAYNAQNAAASSSNAALGSLAGNAATLGTMAYLAPAGMF